MTGPTPSTARRRARTWCSPSTSASWPPASTCCSSWPSATSTTTGADLAVELDLDARITNPRGALQGGLLATLVDVVAGRAVLRAATAPLSGVATADLSIHFLKGLTRGPARAAATVVRLGRSLAVVTVDVLDMGTGERCAVATVSFSVAPPEPASPPTPVPIDRRSAGPDHQEQ